MAKLEPTDADVENSMAQLLARGESSKPVDDVWRTEIKSLLNLTWASRSPQLQATFQEWVIDVATTSNFRTVVDGLFAAYCRSFAPSPEEKTTIAGQTDFLFRVIRDLCWRIPVTMQILPAVILQNQPIFRRPAQLHSAYCSAVLQLSVPARLVRRQLVTTVMSHLLALDVRLPRDVVMGAVKGSQQNYQQAKLPQPEIADFISKLDYCMDAVFEFIERLPELSVASNADDSIDLICEYFLDILAAFDAVVFRSSSASHINFILFYACSRYPQLAALLLDHLWSRIVAEDKAEESRRSALFYFTSFVARAKFLTVDQLRTSVSHLAEFAHFMRSKIAGSSESEVSSQGSWISLFDAATEALIYVVVFHHATLCSGCLGFRFVRSLKLGELINCPTDPLSRCRETVVGMFYQVAERYQLALTDMRKSSCRTESMCSIDLGSTPGDNDTSESPMLLAAAAVESSGNSFFPFDPYMLPYSGQRMRQHYQEFDPSDLLMSSDESDAMDSDDDDDEDDEDDIEDNEDAEDDMA